MAAADGFRRRHAQAGQLTQGQAGFGLLGADHLPVALPANSGRDRYGAACFPTVPGEIIAHAGDGVGRVIPDVALAIAIPIGGQLAIAAGHELRHAHRASIGAERTQIVHAFLPAQQQELFQFAAEEAGAPRIFKTEGRQGVDHPVLAGLDAIGALDADDRGHHLGRHAITGLGPGQRRLVQGHEVAPAVDAFLGQEQLAVGMPGLGLVGFGHRVQNAGHDAGGVEGAAQLPGAEAVLAAHVGDEIADIAALRDAGRRREQYLGFIAGGLGRLDHGRLALHLGGSGGRGRRWRGTPAQGEEGGNSDGNQLAVHRGGSSGKREMRAKDTELCR